jgi:4-hydroxybenzoate polyprenyltransferase
LSSFFGLLKTLRPKQWTKNGFIFAALVFDLKLFQVEPFIKTTFGFVLLCLISGTVYLINDLVDIEKLLQIVYSLRLKNVVILDVLTIAAGFVLRVAGGVVLVAATRFSPWLYVVTVLLALFLGLGKRREELILLKNQVCYFWYFPLFVRHPCARQPWRPR